MFPQWFSWQVLTPYVLAIPGWIALWRTWRSERVTPRFLFHGVENLSCQDAETGEYMTPAIYVTVTNNGKRPVTIERFTCEVRFDGDSHYPIAENHAYFIGAVLGQGQSHSGCIELPSLRRGLNTAGFTSAFAVDTTGRKWKPTKSELEQLRNEGIKVWPTKRKTPTPN